jgi:hypothetical protein
MLKTGSYWKLKRWDPIFYEVIDKEEFFEIFMTLQEARDKKIDNLI